MLLINAIIPLNDQFVPDMRVRLKGGCITDIGADLSPLPGEEVIDLAGDHLLDKGLAVRWHPRRLSGGRHETVCT